MFHQISILIFILVSLIPNIQDGEKLLIYKDKNNRFTINYPKDWIVKQSITENTIFKATYKIDDENIKVITVNRQFLDNNYNISQFSSDEIFHFTQELYGKEKVKLMKSGTKKILRNDIMFIICDINSSFLGRKINISNYLIYERYLYTITASISKNLYSKQEEIFLINIIDSFSILNSKEDSKGSESINSLKITKPGEKVLPALFHSFVDVYLKYLAILLFVISIKFFYSYIKKHKA